MILLFTLLILCGALILGLSVPLAFGLTMIYVAFAGDHDYTTLLTVGALAHERVGAARHSALHHGGRHHGARQDRRPARVARRDGRRALPRRPHRGGGGRERHLRLHLRLGVGDAHLHRRNHDAAAPRGELSARHRGGGDRKLRSARPAHPAERHPDHLCLGDAAVRPQVLSRHGDPRAHPRGPDRGGELRHAAQVPGHQDAPAVAQLRRRLRPRAGTRSRPS